MSCINLYYFPSVHFMYCYLQIHIGFHALASIFHWYFVLLWINEKYKLRNFMANTIKQMNKETDSHISKVMVQIHQCPMAEHKVYNLNKDMISLCTEISKIMDSFLNQFTTCVGVSNSHSHFASPYKL